MRYIINNTSENAQPVDSRQVMSLVQKKFWSADFRARVTWQTRKGRARPVNTTEQAVEREYLPCLQQTKNYESVWTRLCFGCDFVFDFRGFTRVFSGNETATNSESER